MMILPYVCFQVISHNFNIQSETFTVERSPTLSKKLSVDTCPLQTSQHLHSFHPREGGPLGYAGVEEEEVPCLVSYLKSKRR